MTMVRCSEWRQRCSEWHQLSGAVTSKLYRTGLKTNRWAGAGKRTAGFSALSNAGASARPVLKKTPPLSLSANAAGLMTNNTRSRSRTSGVAVVPHLMSSKPFLRIYSALLIFVVSTHALE